MRGGILSLAPSTSETESLDVRKFTHPLNAGSGCRKPVPKALGVRIDSTPDDSNPSPRGRHQRRPACSETPPPRNRRSHTRAFGAGLIALSAITVGLVACGGGGGSSSTSTPVPTPTPLASITLTDKTATGVVTKTNPIKFAVTPSGTGVTSVTSKVTLTCDGNDVAVTTSTVPVTGGDVTALPASSELPNGGACTYTLDGSAVNAGGTANATQIAGAFQVKFSFARLNLVVFADQSGYIGVINDATGTVTPLVNKSGYTDGIEPIRLCGLYDKLLDDGRPLASCVTRFVGNTRRNFPINPLTGEMMAEYTGAVPTGAVWHDVAHGVFGDTPYVNFGISLKGEYIDVPSVGTYYFTDTDHVNLRLTKDSFVTNKVVATCGDLGCFQYLATFSNP